MSLLETVGKFLSPSDPELVQKTLARIDEQDAWNDIFSTKLIEVLDKIDNVKTEIRTRKRRIEQTSAAESLLLNEAARFESLNGKLSAVEKAYFEGMALCDEARGKYEALRTGTAESLDLRAKVQNLLAKSETALTESKANCDKAIELFSGAASAHKAAKSALEESTSAYRRSDALATHAQQELRSLAGSLEAAERTQLKAAEQSSLAQRDHDAAIASLTASRELADEARRESLAATHAFNSADDEFQEARKQLLAAEQRHLEAERKQVLSVKLLRKSVILGASGTLASSLAILWTAQFHNNTALSIWICCSLALLVPCAGFASIWRTRNEI